MNWNRKFGVPACFGLAIAVGALCLPRARAQAGREGPLTTRSGDAVRPHEATTRPATQPAATRPAGIYTFTMKDIDGRYRSLAEFRGKVVLIVNVASRCGYTSQYRGLQKLYREYKDKDFVIIGVPSNDFREQEPGTEAQIKDFCEKNYGVTFPLLAKVSVKSGPQQVPLYQYLTQKSSNGVLDAKVSWNFNKFLIGRDGRPVRHYESKIAPDDSGLRADIDAALH